MQAASSLRCTRASASVLGAVDARREKCGAAGRGRVRRRAIDPENAPVAADPETSAPVLEEAEYRVVVEALLRGDGEEPSLRPAREASSVRADPQDAALVLEKRVHDVDREAVGAREDPEHAVLQAMEPSPVRADPRARAVSRRADRGRARRSRSVEPLEAFPSAAAEGTPSRRPRASPSGPQEADA